MVKTRLQGQLEAPKDVIFLSHPSSHHFRAHNTLVLSVSGGANSGQEGFYQIIKYEGVGTLWRGLTPTLFMTVPGVTLYVVISFFLQDHSPLKLFHTL